MKVYRTLNVYLLLVPVVELNNTFFAVLSWLRLVENETFFSISLPFRFLFINLIHSIGKCFFLRGNLYFHQTLSHLNAKYETPFKLTKLILHPVSFYARIYPFKKHFKSSIPALQSYRILIQLILPFVILCAAYFEHYKTALPTNILIHKINEFQPGALSITLCISIKAVSPICGKHSHRFYFPLDGTHLYTRFIYQR